MKTAILRSIGISLFLICLSFSVFADGEMGTGSISKSGCGFAADTTSKSETKTDDTTTIKQMENDFLGWITGIFADILS